MRQFCLSKRFSLKEEMNVPTIRGEFEERLGKIFKIVHLKEDQEGKINLRIIPRARSISSFRNSDVKAECEFLLSGKDLRIFFSGTIRLPKEKVAANIAIFMGLFFVFCCCEMFADKTALLHMFELWSFAALLIYFRLRTDQKKQATYLLLSEFLDSFECEFKE
jgi:hypothetical protein